MSCIPCGLGYWSFIKSFPLVVFVDCLVCCDLCSLALVSVHLKENTSSSSLQTGFCRWRLSCQVPDRELPLGHVAAAVCAVGSVGGRPITKGVGRCDSCWTTRYMALPVGPQSGRAGVKSWGSCFIHSEVCRWWVSYRGLGVVFTADSLCGQDCPGGLQSELELSLRPLPGP